MSSLRQTLTDYLKVRRALGYKLERAGKLLPQFLDYLENAGAETVTIKHAVAWATLPAAGNGHWWAFRLNVVRGFATYLQTVDPAAEVPPKDLLVDRPHRATPYLYSDQEIAALIAAADTLRFPLRRVTYRTLIGLLAVTGLRVGEAIRLDRGDIDFEHGLLTVLDSKFGKSREIPLHPSTIEALRAYLRERDRLCPPSSSPAVFISPAGTRLIYCNVHSTFRQLRRHAGLKPRSGSCRPRIHDLRHTFAVKTLLDAYHDDGDVQPRLSLLSTYLGHVNPSSTYWYLSAAPELLALAGRRLERHLGGQS
ncbi:MAG: tyrosine-type recombinase/integrase [Solirubrobacterales bacterium]|nr:tyrosine-type recombinase/integrase [Solirubrobacterales bacterium]